MLINYTKIMAVLLAFQLHIIYISAYLNLYFVPDRPCRKSFGGGGESKQLCLVLTWGKEIRYFNINPGFHLCSSLEMTLAYYLSFSPCKSIWFVLSAFHFQAQKKRKPRKMPYSEQSRLLFSPQPVLSTSTSSTNELTPLT